MKKHLAMLCGVYFPEPSPTGLCVKRFASLLKGTYDIDIICISSADTPKQTVQDGFTVYALLGERMKAERRSHGPVRKLLHAAGAVQMKASVLGNLSWFQKAALEQLTQLHRQHPLDAVFSVCSPFAAHCAARSFHSENPQVRWCAYTVDPLASQNRIRPFFVSSEKLAALECATCSSADVLLLSEEISHIRQDLRGCNPSSRVLPYMLPMLPLSDDWEPDFSKQHINCVYAGRFYADLRNPKPMLEAFCSLPDKTVRLHLYSTGCEQIVSDYAARDCRIVLHTPVTHNKIPAIYRAADILVNVENSVSDYFPSKTFEYIAACKPILSFGHGQSNALLAAHPAAFLTDGTKTDVPSLECFLKTNRSRMISSEEIAAIYGKHSAMNIQHILTEALL